MNDQSHRETQEYAVFGKLIADGDGGARTSDGVDSATASATETTQELAGEIIDFVITTAFLINYITADSKTNWAEGYIMVAFYTMIVRLIFSSSF